MIKHILHSFSITKYSQMVPGIGAFWTKNTWIWGIYTVHENSNIWGSYIPI